VRCDEVGRTLERLLLRSQAGGRESLVEPELTGLTRAEGIPVNEHRPLVFEDSGVEQGALTRLLGGAKNASSEIALRAVYRWRSLVT